MITVSNCKIPDTSALDAINELKNRLDNFGSVILPAFLLMVGRTVAEEKSAQEWLGIIIRGLTASRSCAINLI